MKGGFMRFVIIVLVSVVLLATVAFAGEKEEQSWKAEALVAKFKIASQEVKDANEAFTKAKEELTKFAKELDAKGFQLQMDGQIVEKPKPSSSETQKKPEPPKK